MKPNFDEMSKAELKAYILSHRDDDDAICVLFNRRNPPDSDATWYGLMHTPEGMPIEENIRIAEEAIRQRAERDREKELQKERELEEKLGQEVEARLWQQIEQEQVNFRKNAMTTIASEEIAKFREQLRDYPEAIAALDVIEQRNGNLETAATILAIRAGYEQSRQSSLLDELSEKCRKVICQEEFREDLAAGVIVVLVEPLATSAGIPPGLATALAIYVFKTGVKKFCQTPDSES